MDRGLEHCLCYHHAERWRTRVDYFVIEIDYSVLQGIAHDAHFHWTETLLVRIVKLTLEMNEEQFTSFVEKRVHILARHLTRYCVVFLRFFVVVDVVHD